MNIKSGRQRIFDSLMFANKTSLFSDVDYAIRSFVFLSPAVTEEEEDVHTKGISNLQTLLTKKPPKSPLKAQHNN